MKKMLLYFFSLLILITSLSIPAKDWSILFDHAQYQNAKISPDGKFLAVSVLRNNKMGLAFLETQTMTFVGQATFGGKLETGQFYWVNNERVVIKMLQRRYGMEQPQFYGELYSVNYNGKGGLMIYGYQAGELSSHSRISKKESIRGWGEIIDILPEDEKHILISSTPMSNSGERLASVYKLNVYNGIFKRKITTSPLSFTRFITDNSGELSALTGTANDNKELLYIRKEGEWEKVPSGTVGSKVYPLSVSASGKYLYTVDSYQQNLKGIFKLNLENYNYTRVYTDKVVDITDVEMSTDGRSAYAIRVDENYPSYLILNKKLAEAQVFKNLLKSFPYSKITITSKNEDGSKYIVLVSSDVEPGNIYLYDKKENQLRFLFKFKPQIDTSEFAEMMPIQLTSSDNETISGYFTQAKLTETGQLPPVVVLVHGGPHGVRDYWQFSSQVQYLALNGYSVLQVNYRGSGGYGKNFEVLGHKNWGGTIQQDIVDAYQWLVTNKKAKEHQVCIMGASFGAYSAIQSAIKYPDTYKCAIANAGIYDLELMFEEGDIQSRRSGKSYLKNVLGTDQTKLRAMSPVNFVDKINIPLFLAHGEEDERAPFEHVERLRTALDKAKKPYQWFVIDKEGHGFYNPENKKAYMKGVLNFLNENLM